MNTLEFFDAILPLEGWLCLAVPRVGGGFKHIWYATTEEMADAAAKLDGDGKTVYHACASFKTSGARTQANAQSVRSFWLDIDVDPEDPRKYPTRKDAMRDVLTFAREVGWPQPYAVKSGTGLHVYWTLDADTPVAQWKPIADLLKACCRKFGVKADPSRTADSASVLRPVGTTHRKADPRPVQLTLLGVTSDFETLAQALVSWAQANTVEAEASDDLQIAGERPKNLWGDASNDDLKAGVAYDPKWADPIAEQCGFMGWFRDEPEDLDEPSWHAGLGLLAFCEDGDEKAHEWSAGHPDYTQRETNQKLRRIRNQQTGPTLCARFEQLRPDLCAVCPVKGKIKTPTSLGLNKQILAAPASQGPSSGSLPPNTRMPAPTGFAFYLDPKTNRETLAVRTEVETDGKSETVYEIFCRTIFYPISRIETDVGAVVEFERVLPQTGGVRRFTLEGSTIGKGKDGVAGILGANEIVTEGGQGQRYMDSMLKRWMHGLTETAAQVHSHASFGWVEDGDAFVLGDRVITATSEARSILHGPAAAKRQALAASGDVATWSQAIDRAYNHPGQEGYQFMMLMGFAAPLMRFLPSEVEGLTVYAHSPASGVGKTTVCKAALGIWGNPQVMQLSQGKATGNALTALFGTYKSIPILYDELTNIDPREASELIFGVTSGRAKERLASSGDLRTNNSNWRTILMATGNTMLSDKLSSHRVNAEAELSRLFEYSLPFSSPLGPNDAAVVFDTLDKNYGVAAEPYLRHVLQNMDALTLQISRTRAALTRKAQLTSKERFWSALMALVLVSGATAKHLGLVGFDLAALRDWMLLHLGQQRSVRVRYTVSPLDQLGRFLAEAWSGVLVTAGIGNLAANAPAMVVTHPRGAMTGRVILPPSTQASRPPNVNTVLLLSDNAVKAWAVKNGVSAREMFDSAVREGWADAAISRYSLGQGTMEYGAQSASIPVWKLYPDRMNNSGVGALVAQRLNVVAGGNKNASGAGTP